jgi:transposase
MEGTKYVGWDFHKRKSYIVVVNGEGEVIEERKIEHRDMLGLMGFLLGLEKGTPVAIEATGSWYWLVDLLEENGLKPYMAHPKNTKVIAYSKCKTDKIDARILAHLLRTNFLPVSYIPPMEVRELRDLLRMRIFLVKQRTKIKNRIHSILDKFGIFLEYSDIFGKRGREEIRRIELRSPYKEEINILMDLLEDTEGKISNIENIIKRIEIERGWREDLKLLRSVPGIGWFSGLLILAEIGDINRFRSARALCSYAGLVPSTYQSGDRSWYGRITKEGSRWLRWVLVESATRAVSVDGYYKEIYEKLKKRRGKQIAKVAVARKMLTAIYYILKKKEPFNKGKGEG